jgi:hypothetical protein
MEGIMKHLLLLAAVVIAIFAGYQIYQNEQIDQEADLLLSRLELAGKVVQTEVDNATKGSGLAPSSVQTLEDALRDVQATPSRLPRLQAIVVRALKAAQGHIRVVHEIGKLKELPLAEVPSALKVFARESMAAETEVFAASKAFCAYVDQPERSLSFRGQKAAYLEKCRALEAPKRQ